MRTRTVAAALIACACGPTPAPLEGSGSADDTGGDEDPSMSASAEDGPGPGGEVGGNPTMDPDDGADDFDDDGSVDSSSGGSTELCERVPSGLAPGSVIWETASPTLTGNDVVATEYGVTFGGSYENRAAIVKLTEQGTEYRVREWEPLEPAWSVARQIVALPDGVVVVGVDSSEVEEPCAWCWDRWLVAYDDTGELLWEFGLGFGAWAIAATPTGTIVVVGSSSDDDGATFVETLLEIDADGAVLRSVSASPEAMGFVAIPSDAVVGTGGNVVAVGIDSDGPGGWLLAWTSAYEVHWGFGGSSGYSGIALASNDDLVVPEGDPEISVDLYRRSFDGSIVWNVPLVGAPSDLAVDCNDEIVLALGSVTRLDAAANPLWETSLAAELIAVAIDPEGDVVVLARSGDELQIAELAGM